MIEAASTGLRSDVVPTTLLQLDQSPASGLRVVHILWHSGNTDGVSDLLHLILHARSKLASLLVAIDMDLLRPAHDDEHRDIARLQHAGVQNVNVTDIQDSAVRLETVLGVLVHQRGVDLELSGREPELENLDITLDVGVQNLREDVLAHFLQEGLELEAGIHFTELLDHHGSLVLGEKAGDAVGDGAGGGDERVFGLVVNRLHVE